MISGAVSRRFVVAAWILLGVPAAQATEVRLMVTGSSTMAPLLLEIGRRFEQGTPGMRVDVQSGGSSRGLADVRAGVARIGMVSRALTHAEADLVAHTIAMDGVAVIVNKANPIRELSDDQVRAIYRGEVANWRSVGGPDRPITVVNKAEGRSTLDLFLRHYRLQNSEIHAHVVIGENQQGIKTVAGNPSAIGYVSIGTGEYEAAHGASVRLLPMDGVAATVARVRDGHFPLSRPLNLVTRGEPAGAVKQFIDFAQSTVVHDLIEAQFFVAPAR